MDASERIDPLLGQLTSPLFTQESELSDDPFKSGSLTHVNAGGPMQSNEQPQQQQQHLRGTGKLVRGVESFPNVERSLSKG